MMRRSFVLFAICALAACRDDLGEHVAPVICRIDVDGNVVCERDGGVAPGDGGGGGDASGDGRTAGDGGPADAGDGGPADAGDGGPADAGDGGADDGGVDAGDGGADDGGVDAGDQDAGDQDAGDQDAGDQDAGDQDAGDQDAGDQDAGDQDAGVPDAGTSDATTPVDAGTDAGPGGCPAQPTCADVNPSTNQRCIPMCDSRCTSHYWRWTFWVTQMNVDALHTAGRAEHQGISILGFSYDFDDRFAWNAPGATMPPWRRGNDSAVWRKGDLWTFSNSDNSTTQFRMRTTNPAGETQASTPQSLANNLPALSAHCGMSDLIDRRIYNHGRSLARAFTSDWFYQRLIPMSWVGFAEQCRRADGSACAGTTAVATPAQITQCIASRITDGLCDSQCGNCSYVIPSSGTWADAIRVAGQGKVATFIEGGRTIDYTAGRSGGAFSVTNVAEWECLRWSWGICQAYGWAWHQRMDGFTHCVDRAIEASLPATKSAHPVQALTNGLTGAPKVLTGKFGHNSNTDAEAEFVTFGDCASAPVATMSAAPGACSSVCGGATPCVSGTNTARSRWSRTAGWHNVDDLSAGLWPTASVPPTDATWLDPARPIPICRDGGFPVYGM